MTAPHLQTGKQAEKLAGDYLTGKNFAILSRNWFRPWGELDIVARKNGILHFVEVKGESQARGGFDAWRRANRGKLEKVIRTAKTWMVHNRYSAHTPWQIDIIQVSIRKEKEEAHITHFKNVLL